MKTKIILSSNILWTITQFRIGLIKALVSAGFEVVCVADTDEFSSLSEQKVRDAGARFIRLKVNRKGVSLFQDLKYALNYHRIVKKEKPSLVINYTIKPIIYGSLAAAFRKTPSIAVTTGLGFVFTKNNLLTWFVRKLYWFSLRFPYKVLFLNPDDLNSFIKYKLVRTEKVFWLPGEGINTSYYHADTETSTEPNKNNKMIFILIARLLWEKGVGVYVESARKMKSLYNDRVSFQLLGYLDEDNPGGIKKQMLEKWIGEGVIDYLGITEDVRPVIRAADCVVLPSLREGVPRTLMEAAAMNKPLIATDCPGCSEVVADKKNGFLCQPNDPNDLFEKMQQMLQLTPEEREKMGKEGRKLMLSKFDEKIIIRHYFDLLKEMGFGGL